MFCLFTCYTVSRLSSLREANLRYTDSRVKLTNEIMQGIRAVKSYNWEESFKERLRGIRDQELTLLKAAGKSRAILVSALFAAPSFVAVFSLGMFALMGNALDPTKVFTSLALFNQLRFPLTFFPMLLNSLAEGKVSLERLTKFLLADEVTGYVEKESSDGDRTSIRVQDASFAWTNTASTIASSSTLSGAQEVKVRGRLADINLNVRKGELVAIVGPTGSGKSMLLQALLGELHKEKGRVMVQGKVAYVPQSSWVPNDTLRNIILFGRPMNPKRYEEAIKVAGLVPDLNQLEAGDLTEIGERGVNLSGGQKQRVSIARAVYEDAGVVIFDDPLSALDSEVGANVFKTCIKGALQGKTRILVTHQLNVLAEVDRVVLMDSSEDGTTSRIVDQGSLKELVSRGYDLTKYIQSKSKSTVAEVDLLPSEQSSDMPARDSDDARETAAEAVDAVSEGTAHIYVGNVPPTGALVDCIGSDCVQDTTISDNLSAVSSEEGIVASTPNFKPPAAAIKVLMSKEERAEGAVSLDVYKTYITEGKKPLLLLLMIASFLLANGSQILQQWTVAAWTSDIEYKHRSLMTYLSGVALMASSVAGFTYLRTYLGTLIGAASSASLHSKMANRVLSAPLNYFGKLSSALLPNHHHVRA
jgi:ABC-type multidrug transport system fused ATPase/permease subunit